MITNDQYTACFIGSRIMYQHQGTMKDYDHLVIVLLLLHVSI